MADIKAVGLSKYYGATPVFTDISFDIFEGEKVALVGANGAGKTTLFKILSGTLDFDGGSVHIPRDKKLGIIDQIPTYPDSFTTLDVIKTAFLDIDKLSAEAGNLEQLMANGDKSLATLERYGKVQIELERLGVYDKDFETEKICKGLNIDTEMRAKPFNVLSGGEKTRVNLCRMILENTQILLLDEPTNHLDLSSVDWLGKYLSDYKGTVFTISHDRYFLDECCTRIIEIEHGKIDHYSGSYSYYATEKEVRLEQAEILHERQMEEKKRLEDKSRKMHQWGTERMHKRAFSIDKRIAKMTISDRPRRERSISVKFGDTEYHTEQLLKISDLSKGFDGKTIFSDLNFTVRNGDRIAIVGDNGTGKSTLLKIILQKIQADNGKIVRADGLRPAYLPQEVKFTNPERNLVDTLIYEKDVTAQTARNRLGAFKFQGEDVFKTVSTLSGGEKSRLRLCTLMYDKINILFLDEPTNHLDIKSREWIEEAVEDFVGTLVFVSHDRYFISRFANRILELSEDGLLDFEGSYEQYRAFKQNQADIPKKIAKETVKTEKVKTDNRKGGNKLYQKEQAKIEREIAALEAKNEQLDKDIEAQAFDHEKLNELMNEKNEIEEKLMELMEKWEEVSSLLES